MPFSFSLVEYLLVPGTIVLIGSSITFSTLKNNKNSSSIKHNKLELSENIDLTERENLKNTNQHIRNKFDSIIETSEKVTKDPITFSYQSISDGKNSIKSINYIDITISFVLEPDSEKGKQQESTILFQENNAFIIKRGVPKDHNDSNILPECRYSGSPASNSQNLKTPSTEPKYLEQLKKFLQESKISCNRSRTKGMEFSDSNILDT